MTRFHSAAYLLLLEHGPEPYLTFGISLWCIVCFSIAVNDKEYKVKIIVCGDCVGVISILKLKLLQFICLGMKNI